MPAPVVFTTYVTSTWGTSSIISANGQAIGAVGSGGMQVSPTTITVTPAPTEVTVVVVSAETLTVTTTASGQTVVVTTTALSTMTSMSAFVGDDASGSSQFLPVNSAVSMQLSYPARFLLGTLFVLSLCFLF
ncbi:hypothetical protein EUX98_g3 [Antrodiella citrinella]|uniref:Uncharacterized protein n=1 Tax=Antrodiella citrinella TaxID=2447956 RepID=A0A4S4NDG7_9APHY|nr:hypothetical protein EUX98_g3 [Antrodiella citrinella]